MWDNGTIWAGAREGELRLRVCNNCGQICHPPLPMCPNCQALSWTLRPASGEGRLKAWMLSTHPSDAAVPPRLVAVVELEEGVRFVSNLLDTAVETVRYDMPVRLCFETIDGVVLPQFRPAKA